MGWSMMAVFEIVTKWQKGNRWNAILHHIQQSHCPLVTATPHLWITEDDKFVPTTTQQLGLSMQVSRAVSRNRALAIRVAGLIQGYWATWTHLAFRSPGDAPWAAGGCSVPNLPSLLWLWMFSPPFYLFLPASELARSFNFGRLWD